MNPCKRRLLTALAWGIGGAGLRAIVGQPALADDPAPATPKASPGPVVLRARPVRVHLQDEPKDEAALSYDGTANGPVIRIRKGDTLDVTLINDLQEPTSLQWHGLRGPNAVDGAVGLTGPSLAPGATASIRFTPPDSGLYWFHPAAVPGQPDQTGRGLRGILIVEEPDPPQVDRDLLLVVADRTLDGDRRGPLTVNGGPLPQQGQLAPGGRLRLRVVNASTRRIMVVAVEGARPLLLAIDGQPSELFEPVRDTVPIGPGARFEFMIDMPGKAGATVKVKLRGTERVEGALEPDRVLLDLTVAGDARVPLPAIVALSPNPQLPRAIPLEHSVRADLVMEPVAQAKLGQARWMLNGKPSLDLPGHALLTVKQGGAVTLGFPNKSTEPINLRVHGHAMRLLHSKDDGWEPYWRDSVLLPPDSVTHVAFVADNPGKWLLESTIFDQAAFGLRSWFLVE